MKTKVINLYGGPGTGKSTTATGLFSRMKLQGMSCEYVSEFAKDLVWEERGKALSCQPYILGKQYYKMYRLLGVVDFIITDAPLLLSLYYNRISANPIPELDALAMALYHQFSNINIFLKRVKPYQPIGRTQTESQAVGIDKELKDLLNRWVVLAELPADQYVIDKILNIVNNLPEASQAASTGSSIYWSRE